MRRVRLLLAFATVVTALPMAAIASAQTIDTLSIRGHTRFLADDLLLGRGTGSHGERIAAAYIVSQAKRLGLVPLPGGDFLHNLPLRNAVIDPSSSVVVQSGRDSALFRHGEHFIVNTGGAGAFRHFRGRALFLGQPIHAAELIAAERSMVGRVAVFVGPLGGSAMDIVPALSRAGAAGIVVLVPDAEQYDLFVRSRGASRYYVDADVHDPVWQPALPVLIAGPQLSTALLHGVHVPDSLLQGTARTGLDLGRTVIASIDAPTRPIPAANVAALLPGSDPVLRDQYVVFTAHYDHLGVSAPDQHGDSIYNGFSDNAAGVAMLLAIAEALRREPPARSVLFLFFTGEERGLLGSSYMAAFPPIPLDRVRALINLDAGAPPAPPISWRIAGGDSPLGETAAVVAQRHGWSTTAGSASPNSDHWPFLQRGVPSIFIIPGDEWENTTAEQRNALRQRWDRYHQPGDHWYADFPFAGLGRYAEFALRVALEVANSR
jgi:hypothetical protein